MGCFLACFGSSKDRRRRKQRNKVLPRDQRLSCQRPVQAAPARLEQQDLNEKPVEPIPELRQDKREGQLSLSPKKKVTFDANVKTYEHSSGSEIDDGISEISAVKTGEKAEGKNREEKFAKTGQSNSASSEDGSVISSSGSNPPNYRYQNCRDSDDEVEDLEEDESDLDDEEDEGSNDFDGADGCFTESVDIANREMLCEVNNPFLIHGPNRNARDRSAYVHSVLNPVENVAQWKAVKAMGKGLTPQLKHHQKENVILKEELPRNSFSLDAKSARPEGRAAEREEIAVDASLSNWLGSSGGTPTPIGKNANSKASSASETTAASEKSRPSYSSNSVISFEDRPILGALTLEELRKFSASSTPRRSPSRSPDEVPIIGTVGSYWGHSDAAEDSADSVSVSSFKGIPNTTSKYREDMRVNWHSTPFETRLERALERGNAVNA